MLFTPANRRSYGFDLFDDFFNDPFFTAPASHSTQMQIATFCGQQGRISRTIRAILSGQL